jgi:hypothetical protein
MENQKEFYAVLGVALVAIVSVVYLISTMSPLSVNLKGGNAGITGAVVKEGSNSGFQQNKAFDVDYAKLLFGVLLGVVCIGLVYNMYRHNE